MVNVGAGKNMQTEGNVATPKVTPEAKAAYHSYQDLCERLKHTFFGQQLAMQLDLL